jgi:hypothetical protein
LNLKENGYEENNTDLIQEEFKNFRKLNLKKFVLNLERNKINQKFF